MKKWRKLLTILLCDILGYVVAMGIFLAIFYLVPYKLSADGTVVGDTDNMIQFNIPDSFTENSGTDDGNTLPDDNETDNPTENGENTTESNNSNENNKRPNSGKGSGNKSSGGKGNGSTSGNRDHLGTEELNVSQEEISNITNIPTNEEIIDEYVTENVNLTMIKKTIGSGDDRITYYVADVYVSSLKYLRTAFAEGEYGTNIKQDVGDIASDNNAIFAITGDSYGNNTTGIVIRDGILYRDDENDADVCLLYTDGTMRTYTAQEFDEESVKVDSVWQAWCFGPSLLDGSGNVLTEFVTTSYLNQVHPRAAIGYVAPGHYILVIVDGRDEGYSRGVTISELAAIMVKEGCLTAYNLDGGGSATMYYGGEYVNQSTGRDVSDIIYIPRE